MLSQAEIVERLEFLKASCADIDAKLFELRDSLANVYERIVDEEILDGDEMTVDEQEAISLAIQSAHLQALIKETKDVLYEIAAQN